ncbi:type VI secretion protein [Sphingorhabdus lutea]|uniref:Type VI secretion protein n=2 Tax=Sphingorhabdus lutea TaxID=1913578 RepID=A0A1L3JEG2_9SPHN|nr:type VI secretion protein [Sphingorhabdus lutea]
MIIVFAAFCASIFTAHAKDARLVEILYNPAKVVRIDGQIKVQATIAFDEEEKIENVAIGDSMAWQVSPNKRANILFIKPLSPSARTNMTVITDQRTYLFDLVANSKNAPIYILRFNYPDEPKNEAPIMTASANIEELNAVNDPYAIIDPENLNFQWVQNGAPQLLPTRIYDDGNATFLTWPERKAVPAILIKDQKGMEGPVNFSVRGHIVIVDGVPAQIILRSGQDVATLTNNGPPRPAAPISNDDILQDKGL